MKTRLMLAGGLLLALTGCTTYDYVGGGRSGGYYHGAPSVEYRYPAGYPYNYGYPYYGGYGGYYGGYGNPYYSRPIYRPPHNHRPPPRPPGNGGENRPPPPRPSNNGGSPWRNMDSMRRPPQSNIQPSAPPPPARPAPAPSAPRMNGSPWRNMDRGTQRTVER
ncbi:hypothetical protein ROV86_06865 [Stenotrophomonas pavanii]|jgi:hypothetical protein|uniref:Lipoprotein n=1 Tax=Stenotrophomonas pavanii TaxID=487698 RepID=A0ABM7RF20_9GAMM|nr:MULTISPECIES: hypothetical protein [Stenotrophomonas]MBC9078371.1 hypothetical protein [Stenotrophomonas maltophilia]MBC9093780.1 hypothetical protein [Stenotrophomonas maltophilia]MBH1389386.1 hypothetical protein [Stenotrophomonas maltophilia]MBH1521216.1 hypothetical protein [Stenotrophomonas maltophilia]MBH1626205.1 hypothetical protein [Stenotrophomonas maltophilia]